MAKQSACTVVTDNDNTHVTIQVRWGQEAETRCGAALRTAVQTVLLQAPPTYINPKVTLNPVQYGITFSATRQTSMRVLQWLHSRVCSTVRTQLTSCSHASVSQVNIPMFQKKKSVFYMGDVHQMLAHRATTNKRFTKMDNLFRHARFKQRRGSPLVRKTVDSDDERSDKSYSVGGESATEPDYEETYARQSWVE